ncbi:MAG: sigma-70 family RNA polymerase sigma factor [Lentisphaerae bacterium]|nr:MAG: sigma-70 family RNA polymerase sigma factor [Lentisphaerota bacterium]
MNEKELTKLIQLHQHELYAYVRYLGASPDISFEIIQEALIAAYRSKNAPPADNSRRCRAWLRGIARNCFLKWCRRKRYERRMLSEITWMQAEEFWQQHIDHTAGNYSNYLTALQQCRDVLPQREQLVIELRYRQRLSRQAMAKRLGLSPDGVKSLLRRIRNRLRICIRSRL